MSSDPTPPPPGDNSLESWKNYEAKAVEKDRESDRETIDKMLAFQKQFGELVIAVFEFEILRCFEASNSPSRPLLDGPSPSPADPPLAPIPEVAVGPSLPPPVDVLPPPPEPVASSESALASGPVQVSESEPSLPSVPKRSTGPRRMSSKPDVTAAD
ncbi:hypothetical protein H0H93_016657, partial [Arthromyces matolae]